MKRTVVFAFALLSMGLAAFAAAKSYNVTLYDPAMAGATELRAGDYQLKLQNDKAVLHNSKVSAENPVKTETAEATYRSTSVILEKDNAGKMRIREIHLGGTKTRLVFTETQP